MAALSAGMFAWGMHLGPGRPAGHDLLKSPLTTGRTPVAGVSLTSLKQRVVQNHDHDSPAADDANGGDAGDSDSPGAVFQDIYALIQRNYVDPLPDDTHMAHGAAAAMLLSLQDPASRFLEPAEMAELTGEARGQYHGLGAVTEVRKVYHPHVGSAPNFTEMRLTVVAPLPGSPAEKAGLQPGDAITAIDGHPLLAFVSEANGSQGVGATNPAIEYRELLAVQKDPVTFNKLAADIEKQDAAALTLTQAETKLTDGTQKALALTVARRGTPQPISVTVDDTVTTNVPPVTGRMLLGGIGYLKISQFTDGTDAQFASSLSALDPNLKGLVLDLRDCPGGLRDVGAAVAAKLTTATSLGLLETTGKKDTPLTITPARAVACPIVVLVNGGTANTAELLAATLQAGGSKLVGTSTFGDASEVRPISLRDGSGFTITVGKLRTAQNKEFAHLGIKEDVYVPDAPGGDAPLMRAIGILSGQVARR